MPEALIERVDDAVGVGATDPVPVADAVGLCDEVGICDEVLVCVMDGLDTCVALALCVWLGDGVAEGVEVCEGDGEGLGVPLPLPLTAAEELCEGAPLFACVALRLRVAEPVAVEEAVGVPDPGRVAAADTDCDSLGVTKALGVPVALVLGLKDALPLCDEVATGVPLTLGVREPLRDAVGVLLCETTVRVCVRERDMPGVNDGVPEGLAVAACEPLALDVPVVDSEGLGLGGSVGEPLAVPDAVMLRLDTCVALRVGLGVDVELRVRLGVVVELAVPLPVGVDEPDMLRVVAAEGEPVALPVPLRLVVGAPESVPLGLWPDASALGVDVALPDAAWDALPVGLAVAVALGVRALVPELDGVVLADGVPEPDTVPLCEGVAAADPVPLGVAAPLPVPEAVHPNESVCVPVCDAGCVRDGVRVIVRDRVDETVIELGAWLGEADGVWDGAQAAPGLPAIATAP